MSHKMSHDDSVIESSMTQRLGIILLGHEGSDKLGLTKIGSLEPEIQKMSHKMSHDDSVIESSMTQ